MTIETLEGDMDVETIIKISCRGESVKLSIPEAQELRDALLANGALTAQKTKRPRPIRKATK